jgi:hypothetical protein
MNSSGVQCPNCSQQATGRFCSNCGASLTAEVAPARTGAKTIVPWVAVGLAVGALVVMLYAFVGRDSPPLQFLPAGSTVTQPPDLSEMTPREAADRLFNRIMTAVERGDTQEALRFAPMALQAYGLLGPLDNDARYHVGLIHATTGDIKSARAHVNMLRQSVPDHLLGIMLEHTIATQRGDQDSALRAYKTFLTAYESQIATGRTEYEEHQSGIDSFRRAAKTRIGENP